MLEYELESLLFQQSSSRAGGRTAHVKLVLKTGTQKSRFLETVFVLYPSVNFVSINCVIILALIVCRHIALSHCKFQVSAGIQTFLV